MGLLCVWVLTESSSLSEFLFLFVLLLPCWLPLFLMYYIPGKKGRILEINKNGLVEYDRNNIFVDFHTWDTLVEMKPRKYRYGFVTLLKFSDGKKIKFWEQEWIVDIICEKSSYVSKEKYFKERRETSEVVIVLCIAGISNKGWRLL